MSGGGGGGRTGVGGAVREVAAAGSGDEVGEAAGDASSGSFMSSVFCLSCTPARSCWACLRKSLRGDLSPSCIQQATQHFPQSQPIRQWVCLVIHIINTSPLDLRDRPATNLPKDWRYPSANSMSQRKPERVGRGRAGDSLSLKLIAHGGVEHALALHRRIVGQQQVARGRGHHPPAHGRIPHQGRRARMSFSELHAASGCGVCHGHDG